MDRWKGKVAIVTGASSGIGAAIAEKLAEAGVKVVGLARNKEKVEELAKTLKSHGSELHAVGADVTKEEDILAAFKWVKDHIGPIHILINNAGVGRAATLIDGKTQLWKDVLDTNVLGLCIATREAVKDMRENNVNGHIVHINSVLGHRVSNLPNTNVYAASKFAVTALTETLRNELNAIASQIKISSISPGLVNTSIFSNSCRASGLGGLSDARKAALEGSPSLQSADVADAVLYILGTPPHVQVHELIIKPIGEI